MPIASIQRPKTTMSRAAQVCALTGLIVACAPIACVDNDQDAAETVTSALGAFSTWQNISTPNGQIGAPTIVRVKDKQVAFTTGPGGAAPMKVYWASRSVVGSGELTTGTWTSWTTMSNIAEFRERPAVIAFDVPSTSPLAGKIALVGRKMDNRYYVRIQAPEVCNSCGVSGVIQNWLPIGGTWTSAPGLAFVPASSTTAPKNTLAIVGRGTDNRYYYTENTLTAQNNYDHLKWISPIPAFGNETFTSAPAITYACVPGASLFVAGNNGTSMLFNSHNGFSFHPWATSNGIFISGTGPALAAGCLGTTGEASAYGIGTDNRIWVSPVLDVNAVNWTPIGTTTFRSVAASAWLDTVTVTGRASAGTGSDFQGLSTSVTSPACTSSSACGATAFCEFRGNSCGGEGSCSYQAHKVPGHNRARLRMRRHHLRQRLRTAGGRHLEAE